MKLSMRSVKAAVLFAIVSLTLISMSSLTLVFAQLLFVEHIGGVNWDRAHSVAYVPHTISAGDRFVVGGATTPLTGDDFLLIVLDGNGGFLSALTQANLGPDICYDVIRTLSDDIVVTGAVWTANHPNGDLFIAKFTWTSNDHNVLSPEWMWICTAGTRSEGHSVAQTPEGGYIVTGTIWDFAGVGMDVIVAKFSLGGAFLWGRVLIGPNDECGSSVIQRGNIGGGDIFVTGWTTSFGSFDALVAKFTGNGNFAWAVAFGGTNNDVGTSADGTDTTIFVTGWTDSFGPTREFFVARLTYGGGLAPLWVYGGTGDDQAFSLVLDFNGNLVITGSTTSPGTHGGEDLMLASLNSVTGAPMWGAGGYVVGGNSNDGGFKVIKYYPGAVRYAAAGYTYSPPSLGLRDILLATFNQLGHTATYPDCERAFNFTLISRDVSTKNLNNTLPITDFVRWPPKFRPINLTRRQKCGEPGLGGTPDMMVGSLNYSVLGYRNTGNFENPNWARVPNWDISGIPGDRDRASPCFADLDNDGDYDLLISSAQNIPPRGYRNIGNTTHPIWQRCSAWDVPNLGSYEQNPDLADLDGDGDYDLVIGTELDHCARFFENNGTAQNPSWKRKPDWDIPSAGVEWPSPAFADLDDDGDYDLLFGSFTESYCAAWENTGTYQNSSWTRKTEWDITALPSSYHKKPALVDLDNDGDYDLMVGVGNHTDSTKSKIWAYENTGTPSSPQWTRKPTWDIKTPEMASMTWIRPAFANLDGTHDVGIHCVSLPASEAYPGWPIRITQHNGGNYPEMCNVTTYLDDIVIGVHATPLPPETDDELDFIIPFEPDIDYYVNYTLRVEVSPIPGETILDNNIYFYGTILIKMVGDVNCDQVIDIFDIVSVGVCFGAEYGKPPPPGTQPYNPNADIVEDNIIDIFDIVAIGIHFGETDP